MSVDTIVILPSMPAPQEIAAALRAAFLCDVEIGTTSVDGMYSCQLPDPSGKVVERRYMHIHTQSRDYEYVCSGRKVICSLGAYGGSVMIMEALAKAFGGLVCDRDDEDSWRPITKYDGSPIEIPPVDRLRIEIEKIVGADASVHLARIAGDREKMDALFAAYQNYRVA